MPLNRAAPVAVTAKRELLKLEIESGRNELRRLESSLRECEAAVTYYSGVINQDRRRLKSMESATRAGLYVDEAEYGRTVARHNANVELHNAELANCRSLADSHKRVWQSTNARIADYNRMISQR